MECVKKAHWMQLKMHSNDRDNCHTAKKEDKNLAIGVNYGINLCCDKWECCILLAMQISLFFFVTLMCLLSLTQTSLSLLEYILM